MSVFRRIGVNIGSWALDKITVPIEYVRVQPAESAINKEKGYTMVKQGKTKVDARSTGKVAKLRGKERAKLEADAEVAGKVKEPKAKEDHKPISQPVPPHVHEPGRVKVSFMAQPRMPRRKLPRITPKTPRLGR